MKRFGTKKPHENHAPCLTRGCENFFNITYKNTDGLCKSCRKNNKKYSQWKTILSDNLRELKGGCEICGLSVKAPKREDGINVCDKCNEKHPIRK